MRNHHGFTLIELMVTISVAAIIMAIAIPSMQLMQANARMASAANDLSSDLKRTRSDAISYRTNYTITPIGGTNWSNGWLATYNVSSTA
ncbi:MAG: GspH/FimT family pseudopilin, partial [Agitococcus sp.]|nr:GspH/FimT family pseudopilin [Agitococcus sp.]